MKKQLIEKTVLQLKKGDVVRFDNGLFEVTESAEQRRPYHGPFDSEFGPWPFVVAKAVCLEGHVPGYYKPGSEWTFQGNIRRTVDVVVNG